MESGFGSSDYSLVPARYAKEAGNQYKLKMQYSGKSDITYFNIVSNWYGEDLDDLDVVDKVLLMVSSEEFESVKNLLTILRS